MSEYARPWPGGISEHVHHEIDELSSRGHSLTLLSGPCDPHSAATTKSLPWAIKFEGNGARSRMAFGALLGELRRELSPAHVDVVHVHAPLDPILCLAAVLAARVPVVGTFHASHARTAYWRMLYGSPWTRRAFSLLARRITVSAEAERTISAFFSTHFVRIPNGVDTSRFRPIARAPERPPTLVFLGRADPRKGLGHAIRAFAVLRKTVTNARLVVIGATAGDVRDAANGTSLEGVDIRGYVEPATVPEILSAADVLLAPSLSGESQGIILLEAMASGVVPVAYAIPGYAETVRDGRDGVLVRVGDASGMGNAAISLLRDGERWRTLAREARLSAESFSWSRVGSEIESVLADAAAER